MLSKRLLLQAAAAALVTPPAVAQAQAGRAKPLPPRKRIATEETFAFQELYDAAEKRTRAKGNVAGIMQNLPAVQQAYRDASMDVGPARIAKMDADGVTMQLLSLGSPGVQIFEADEATTLARLSNDKMAAAIARYPTRYAGLAAIAPQDPVAAAGELERAVTRLGLKGAIINSHTNDEYLDLPKFSPIFEAAQALDVALYIHPRTSPTATDGTLKIRGFTVGWSYAVETGSHVLKLIAAGVFDRYPRLKVVIGHMGEMIPFYLDRIDNRYAFEWAFAGQTPPLALKPSDYFRRNIWVTTSGENYWIPLRATIDQIGIDRILWAADYPYEDQRQSVNGIENTPLSEADKDQIFHANAQTVFKL